MKESDPGFDPPARLRGTASWLLTHAAMPASRIAGEALAAVGGHKYHVSLLASLEEFGPASQADLGRRTGIDRSDVVAMLNDLTAAGYVERAPDPQDRRRNVVTLTTSGRKRLQELGEAAETAQRLIFAPLTDAEIGRLMDLLGRVVDHHRRP